MSLLWNMLYLVFKEARMPIRPTLLFLITILLYSNLSAQTKMDSLINTIDEWEEEKQDSNLYNTYYDLIKMTYGKDMDTCQYFLNKSLVLAEEIDFKPGLQRSSYLLAVINSKKGDYENSLELLEVCIQAYPQSVKRHMRCLKMKGDFKRNKVNYDEAAKYYDEAEKYGVEVKDTVFLGTLYNSRAILYEDLSQLDKSVENYLKSAQIDKNRGDINGYFFSVMNIASQYIANYDYEKAESYINSLRVELDTLTDLQEAALLQKEAAFLSEKADYDKAIKKFEESNRIAKKIKYKGIIASNYLEIGKLLFESAQYEMAYTNFLTGLDYVTIETRIFSYYIWLGNSRINLGDCTGAEKWLNKAKGKVNSIKNYKKLRRYYSVAGKYYACINKPALSAINIDSSLIYSDSFYFERREIESRKIEATYQTKIKSDSISILTLQNEKQDVEISRRNIGLGTVSVILFLLGLLARYYVKLNEKQKQLNSYLESKNEELVFKNQELEKLNQTLEKKAVALSIKPTTQNTPKEVQIKTVDKVYNIDVAAIKYLKAEDDGTRVYYDDTSNWTSEPLKELKTKFPEDIFVQTFRGIIVNINYVLWINGTSLKLKDNTELKISRTYKQDIKDAIEH